MLRLPNRDKTRAIVYMGSPMRWPLREGEVPSPGKGSRQMDGSKRCCSDLGIVVIETSPTTGWSVVDANACFQQLSSIRIIYNVDLRNPLRSD